MTVGHHCFDEEHPAYTRIAALAGLRAAIPALRQGRQYVRKLSNFGQPFAVRGPGEIVAWSRILDDEEVLCAVNAHGREARGGDVEVDADLNPPGATMSVLINTAQVADPAGYAGTHPAGSTVPVKRTPDGRAYVELRDLPASEVLVLSPVP